MDNGPGVSLFQGTEVLQLNTSALWEEEEEEAIEEEKRRNEELQDLLTKAFDELSDDDDDGGHSSVNSSHRRASSNIEGPILSDTDRHSYMEDMTYSGQRVLQQLTNDSNKLVDNACNFFPEKFAESEHNKENSWQQNKRIDIRKPAYQYQYQDKEDTQEAYRQTEYNSKEQLEVLYEVRMREIKHLTEQIEAEQKDNFEFKDQMLRKLALCEAEKERAILSRTQANELLVKSKGEISDLQKEVATLKQNVATLEKTKTELTKELKISHTMINELQQKLTMIERCDVQKNLEKEMDSVVKELKNKHQQEICNLQVQISSVTAKFNQKENECATLEQKVGEMQRAQEQLLVEKSETINQLARSLEESQAQCRQLMASNVSCDNIRLQTLLDEAVQEKKELQRTLQNIQTECDMLRSDVAQYESLTKLSLPGENSSSDETDSIVHLGISQKSNSRRISNMNFTDIGSKLKDELHRAVLNQKAKRMEIYRLQETLNAKEKQIQEMTKKERIFQAQTEALKADMMKISDQLKEQRERENNKENITELISKEEIDRLNERIVQLQKEKQELEKERQEVEEKNKLLEDKLKELVEKIEEEKKLGLEEYNKQYMEFHEETVDKLRKEMEESSEQRLNETRIKLEETLKELDKVKSFYVEVIKAKEELGRELKCERENIEKLAKEKDDMKAELNKMTTIRDHLSRKVQISKQQNEELNSKLKSLEEELTQKDSTQTIVKLKKECDDLREEISKMSNNHADELSKVRMELVAARERLIKLEKNMREQLEAEMVKVQSEKEQLRLQFDEREKNLKRIIEAQKRRPILRDIGTEVLDLVEDRGNFEKITCDCEKRLKELKENHNKELAVYKEKLDSSVKDHQEQLQRAVEEEVNKIQEHHRQLLETIQKRIIEEEENIKVKHTAELALVEEKTKDMAVKYFAEEFRRLEAQFVEQLEEANKRPDSEELARKTEEVNVLKQAFSKTYKEYEKKVAALNQQIEKDREKIVDVMNHYAQEVKTMKLEISKKDTTIDELKSKLKSVRQTAKVYRNQLAGSRNNLIAAQAKMEAILTEKEKEVDIRIEEIERQYESKEKELRNKINRRART